MEPRRVLLLIIVGLRWLTGGAWKTPTFGTTNPTDESVSLSETKPPSTITTNTDLSPANHANIPTKNCINGLQLLTGAINKSLNNHTTSIARTVSLSETKLSTTPNSYSRQLQLNHKYITALHCLNGLHMLTGEKRKFPSHSTSPRYKDVPVSASTRSSNKTTAVIPQSPVNSQYDINTKNSMKGLRFLYSNVKGSSFSIPNHTYNSQFQKASLNANITIKSNRLTPEKNEFKARFPRSATSRLELRPRDEGISTEAKSLTGLLVTLVQTYLSDCTLLVAYNDNSNNLYSSVVHQLVLLLSNTRQVVFVRSGDELQGMRWSTEEGCRGYIMLLEDFQPFLSYTNTHIDHWDYQGRYVVVCQSLDQLEALVGSKTGKKTEYVLGAVKSRREGEWRLYTNVLYWGWGVRSVNTWRQNRFTSQVDLFPDKFSDLRGAVLTVSTFEFAPSIMYYQADNGTLLFPYGRDIALTNMVGRTLNFTPQYNEPADGHKWGSLVDGSWTGMMGEVTRDEAEIGIASLYIKIDRNQILDFSAPYADESACFLARVEPPIPRWQALAFPFQRWTWLAILVGIIVSGPVLFLFAAASNHCDKETKCFTQFGYSFFYSVGLHFREPQNLEPRMDSTRVFVLFLWLYTMIITIAYSTNLTAFLLVRKPLAAIQTIDELYDARLEVASLGVSGKDWLEGQKLVELYKAYDRQEEAFKSVLEGKAVFWMARAYLNFHIVTSLTIRGVPRARIMRECFMPYSVALGLQRHSPLKRKFDQVIGWVQQSGLLAKAVDDALQLAATTKEYSGGGIISEDEEDDDSGGGVVALNLDHLQGVFMLAGLGYAVALHVFLVEVFVVRTQATSLAQTNIAHS